MLRLFAYLVLIAALQLNSASPIVPKSKFTGVSVEYSPEFVSKLTGWISPEGTLNVDLYANRTITPGMRTTITILYRIEVSDHYMTLFSYDLDMCKTVKDLMNSALTSTWFRNIRKYGNLSGSCPIKTGYFNMRNFQLDDSSIPVYLRSGNYRLRVYNYYGKPNTNANTNPNPKSKTRRLVTAFIVDMKLY